MSRTFRRKNYEQQQRSRTGSKTNGYYTEWDKYVTTGNGHGGCPVFRPMTEQEKNAEYWRIHGESKHNNAWGPGRYYKLLKEKTLRMQSKRELHTCLRTVDHEGIFVGRQLRHWDINYW